MTLVFDKSYKKSVFETSCLKKNKNIWNLQHLIKKPWIKITTLPINTTQVSVKYQTYACEPMNNQSEPKNGFCCDVPISLADFSNLNSIDWLSGSEILLLLWLEFFVERLFKKIFQCIDSNRERIFFFNFGWLTWVRNSDWLMLVCISQNSESWKSLNVLSFDLTAWK